MEVLNGGKVVPRKFTGFWAPLRISTLLLVLILILCFGEKLKVAESDRRKKRERERGGGGGTVVAGQEGVCRFIVEVDE